MDPIRLEKSAHKLLIWWGDLSRQMGTICQDRTTSSTLSVFVQADHPADIGLAGAGFAQKSQPRIGAAFRQLSAVW